jgi:hypothetical protein
VAGHILRAVDPLEHEHVQGVRIVGFLDHGWKLTPETARASNAYSENLAASIRISNRYERKETAKAIGPKAAMPRLA